MIKINNPTSEDNPPWLPGEFPGPRRTSLSGAPAGAVPGAASSDTWTRLRRALVAAARAVPLAVRVLLSWLAALPRRSHIVVLEVIRRLPPEPPEGGTSGWPHLDRGETSSAEPEEPALYYGLGPPRPLG